MVDDEQPAYSASFRVLQGYWVEERDHLPGWTLALRIAETQDGPIAVELRLLPNRPEDAPRIPRVDPTWHVGDTPREGIGRSHVQRLRVTELFLAARRLYRFWYPSSQYDIPRSIVRRGRPGRKGLPPAYYAAIAFFYGEAIRQGSSQPNIAVQKRLEDDYGLPVSIHTVRSHVQKARNRGFLSRSPGRRRRGGEATEAAINEFLR